MGAVDPGTGEYTAFTPWTVENTSYGTFVGLPGDNWVKGAEGYWYYTAIVAPGDTPATPLFTSYTKGTPPADGAGLVMDLTVQAIDAAAGSDYASAWAVAIPSSDGGSDDDGD